MKQISLTKVIIPLHTRFLKLTAVDSNHFIRYKCKITHCLDSRTLSEYIWTHVLDNEKLSVIEVLEVLTGVRTFTSTSKSFRYTKQPSICYNERVKKVFVRSFEIFYFLLGSSIQCLLFVGIRSYFAQRDIVGRWGQIYLSIVKEYFSVEVTHNLPITLVNDAPPKRFSVDFIHFEYCFWFGI